MPTNEVVGNKVQSYCGFEVLPLLAECEREASEPLHVQSCRSVQTLNIGCRYQAPIWIAGDGGLSDRDYFRSAIATFRDNGFDGCVGFNNLAIVNFHSKAALDGVD